MALTPYSTPGLLPFANPVSDWVAPRRNALLGFGAGLLSPGLSGAATGAMQGMQLDRQNAMENAALEQEAEQLNATKQWLIDRGRQDLVPLVDAGQGTFALQQATQVNGGVGDETFFGTAVPMTDADGNVVLGQMSNQGRWQPLQGAEGYSPAPTTKTVDIGNYIVTQDVYGNELYRTPKSGDVPTGFGAPSPTGEIAPMPGGPQAREIEAQQTKASSALNTLESKNQIVLGAIDQALDQASWANTGNVMGNSGWVPFAGQGALDLAKTLETIKANIGFEELQTMRDNSPTGGALGAVTERELAFLQSTIANIEQAQSEDQLRANLQTLRDYLASSAEQRRAAFSTQYGGGQAPQQQAPQGGGYTILGVE